MSKLAKLVAARRIIINTAAPGGSGASRGAGHELSGRKPLWAYLRQEFARPFGEDSLARPLFAHLKPGAGLKEIKRASLFAVFLGLDYSAELLDYLGDPASAVFVVEPDPARFRRELELFPDEVLQRGNVFFLVGDVLALDPPLSRQLPIVAGDKGFPVIFEGKGFSAAYPEYGADIVQEIEVFHYRHHVLTLMDHLSPKALPLRDYCREESLDQLANFYANLPLLAKQPRLADFADCFAGCPAILIGAGPALDNQFEYIRKNQDKALIIGLNNSLKPLLANGIVPHVVVVLDSKLEIEKSFQDVPKLPETLLVTHSLAYSGGGRFSRVLFQGNFRPDVTGELPELAAHASVLITAFSLARFWGVKEIVLAGAQFCSAHASGFERSKFSIHNQMLDNTAPADPLMLPVRAANGEVCHTVAAYLDSGLWFRDEISLSRLTVVNLTPQSLIYGPGIIVDPDYVLEHPANPEQKLKRLLDAPLGTVPAAIADYAEEETGRWLELEEASLAALEELEEKRPDFNGLLALLREFDAANVSFLLERRSGFEPALVNKSLLSGKKPELAQALAHYFSQANKLCGYFLEILTRGQKDLGQA